MSAPKLNPVTPADADRFAGFVKKWQLRLSLSDWRITRSGKRPRGVMGQITRFDREQRMAIYAVGADFGGEKVSDQTLEETAAHEMLHVFLHELIELAKDTTTSDDTLRSAEHRIINVLEALLVPKNEGNTDGN